MLPRQSSLFSVNHPKQFIKNGTLKVGDYLIIQKESVKYLGVYLDRNLNYQAEVKNISKTKSGLQCKNHLFCLRLPSRENSNFSIECPYDQPSPVFIGIIEWFLSEPNFDFRKAIQLRSKSVF